MKVEIWSGGNGHSVKSVVEMSVFNFAYLCKMFGGRRGLWRWISNSAHYNKKPVFEFYAGGNIGTCYTALDCDYNTIKKIIDNI